jgi:GAF domain-containing protein
MHNLEKTNDYTLLLKQVEALIQDEPDYIANMANVASFVYHMITDLNWTGFYLLKEDDLVLGPFNGLPACTRIRIGKGVCGTAAERKQVLNVDDVHLFEGHIACDSASESELVIPVIVHGKVIGVMDIDSPIKNRFDLALEEFMIEVVNLIVRKWA